MQNAKMLSQKDIKEILAKHFNVPISNITTTKYSFIILENNELEEVNKQDVHD